MSDKEAFKQMMGTYVPPVRKVKPQFKFGSLWGDESRIFKYDPNLDEDDLDILRSLLG
jgi:hypothetical protein